MPPKQEQKKIKAGDINYKKMKPGQYQLHVLVQATSGVYSSSGGSSDVMLSLKAFGDTQYSKVKKDVGFQQTFWGQHYFFTKTFDSSVEIENQPLIISVWDRNLVLRNSLIGNYELDVQRIYSETDHVFEHKWLALSNIQQKFNQITGYVKVSISVIGQGDKTMELSVEPMSSMTAQKKVLMPPHISRTTYQLIVEIYQGKDIKPADGDSVDAYIGVQFGQIFQKTQPIMGNVNPPFYKKVFVPLALPAITDNISIRINDFNYIQKTQVIGSHYVNINDLVTEMKGIQQGEWENGVGKVPKKYHKMQWINFYGPQLNANRQDQKNILQFFPDLATCYVGSLLMRFHLEADNSPIRKVQGLQKKTQPFKRIYHRIIAKITGAMNLAQKAGKYAISVRVGAQEVKTAYVKCKNGFCLWAIEKSFIVTTYQEQQVPDVFVYLLNSDQQKICYLRYPATMGVIIDDQWINLKPDLSMTKLQNQQAGYVKIALSMQSISEQQYKGLRQKKIEKTQKPIQNNMAKIFQADRGKGRIIIQLISAENLLPLDQDGSADPLFVFSYMHMQATSTTKNDTLNPIYFEKIIMEAEILDQQSCPPIIVNAFDQDKFSRDFVGTTFIDIGQAYKQKALSFNINEKPTPKWFELTQNNMKSGRFLACFTLVRVHQGSIPPAINIARKKFKINLMMLGLRGMKSTGILSVKKPYIEFDFENLNVYGENSQISKAINVKTQPNQSGSSISIQQINQTIITLPQNPAYWPSLTARVKDYVLGGIYQPILGYFAINLRDAYDQTKSIKQQRLQKNKLNINDILNTKALFKASKVDRLKNIHPKLVRDLRNFIIKSISYNWTILDNNTKLNTIKSDPKKQKIVQKLNPDTIVIFPKYIQEEKGRFVQAFRQKIYKNQEYMAVGFDNKKIRQLPTLENRSKHYRFKIDQPYDRYYEKAYNTKLGMANQIQVRKGRVFPANDLTSTVLRRVSDEDSYTGLYKGNCFIDMYREVETQDDKKFNEHTKHIMQKFMTSTKVWMFLYILEAAQLHPKDILSGSDPYLIIKVGQQVVNLSDRGFDNDSNPQFNEKIKLLLEFPRDSMLEIEIWDKDTLKTDDFIGSAIVDIQNRVLAQIGSVCGNNPIQTHQLKSKQSKLSQGIVRFWLDLVPADQISLYRQISLETKKQAEMEVRVIIWGCTGMPISDIEGMSDLFITCTFADQIQQTDTHYRSSSGDGSFNWRMIFKTKVPVKDPTLTFKVFDRDFGVFKQYLSSGSFSIGTYIEQAWQSDNGLRLYLGTQDLAKYSDVTTSSSKVVNGKKAYDRFQIDMYSKKSGQNQAQQTGKIQLSIQILTQQQAGNKKAGLGRQAPNQHPFLPDPKDRFTWSWNPITLLTRLLGRSFRYKIGCALLCIIIVLLFYNFGHSFLGSILGNSVVPGTK